MAQLFSEAANTYAKVGLFLVATGPFAVFYAGSTISRSPANTKAGVAINQPIPFSHMHHVYELGIDCRYCHTSVEKGAVAGFPQSETCMSCHSVIWTNSPLLEPVRQSYNTGVPLEWNKVAKVPEFVYFDHSIHIARGISCNQCHGPIQQMHMTFKWQPFSMAWCLECHREPEKFLAVEGANKTLSPREQVFDFYTQYQAGLEMKNSQFRLMKGLKRQPTKEEIEEGRRLIETLKIDKAALMDCYKCHR